jgi:hypothetical protein
MNVSPKQKRMYASKRVKRDGIEGLEYWDVYEQGWRIAWEGSYLRPDVWASLRQSDRDILTELEVRS